MLIMVVLFTNGCSTETLKRVGYGMLQDIKEQQCQTDLSAECQQRESYDEYQRKKKQLENSE